MLCLAVERLHKAQAGRTSQTQTPLPQIHQQIDREVGEDFVTVIVATPRSFNSDSYKLGMKLQA